MAKVAAMTERTETTDKDANDESRDAICDEILRIMATYHEQENSSRGVDTPGGLEHMGDVWGLFRKWEAMLRKSQERQP
jgi:hypothetical protein